MNRQMLRLKEPRKCPECGAEFSEVPKSAPHKRFCSEVCRTTFHSKEQQRLLAAARKLEEGKDEE